MNVLVTGATGSLGSAVVDFLTDSGASVRALSRRARPSDGAVTWVEGDVATGAGIPNAVSGVDAVVHLAAAPYRRGYTREVEIDGTARLLTEAHQAGVGHVLYTSILGCDRIPWGYFRIKSEAEQVVRTADVPSTVLRCAQFHGFVDQAFTALARTGVLVADRGVVAQPVDVADVAARIASALGAGPSAQVEEFAGPEVLDLRTAARQWLAVTGKRRAVVPVRFPGSLGQAFRTGHLTSTAEPRGVRTWRDYLVGAHRAGG